MGCIGGLEHSQKRNMTRRRFYAPPTSFDSGHTFVDLPPDEARHLRNVLRLTSEDPCSVFDGEGHEYDCVVSDVRRDSARLKILSAVSPARRESSLHLTLALALLKGDKFDLVVQKSTELGVTEILPVMTKFADVRLRDQSDARHRVTRWQRIALESAKQSGRALVPRISPPLDFEATLQSVRESNSIGVMFSERDGQPFEQAIRDTATQKITALVGSEGGWADEELTAARSLGWKIVTLGGRTLRAETAAIAVTTLLQYRLGDLR
jgi:16S rRNA (uracil1498-N3)-methyltransferase